MQIQRSYSNQTPNSFLIKNLIELLNIDYGERDFSWALNMLLATIVTHPVKQDGKVITCHLTSSDLPHEAFPPKKKTKKTKRQSSSFKKMKAKISFTYRSQKEKALKK